MQRANCMNGEDVLMKATRGKKKAHSGT